MLLLRSHSTSSIPIEAECITPNNLAGKTVAEIAALPLQHGNRQEVLGEFFHVEGDAGDGEVLIEGDCSRIKLLGAEMTSGHLTVRGDAGMHLGADMVGGRIDVFGNVGDWVGASMRGGSIHVLGDAGDLVGAGYRGSRLGMCGGLILIEGKAGNEVGSAMRRGLIAIGGDTGEFLGVSLIAGTIFVFGAAGLRPGAGMKRGSLVFCGPRPTLLPTFRYDCEYQPVFLKMYLLQLRRWGFPIPECLLRGPWQRHSGDLVALGKGEVLHCNGIKP